MKSGGFPASRTMLDMNSNLCGCPPGEGTLVGFAQGSVRGRSNPPGPSCPPLMGVVEGLTFESCRRLIVAGMSAMRISQLAERSGVPATTLRFYEDAGLLPADRTQSGYRLYGEDAVERLELIGAAKHLGLPLEEIGQLLAVWESGACSEVKADLRPRLAARLADAERRATEQRAFATFLHTALEQLDALPDRAGRCDPECGFHVAAAAAVRPVEVALTPRRRATEPDTEPGTEKMAEPWRAEPVACSLSGQDMAERVGAWGQAIDGAVRAQIPDGLRLTLPVDRAAAIAGLAAAEHRCCPFFDFRLHIEGAWVHLEVRAPQEGAGLLSGLFGALA